MSRGIRSIPPRRSRAREMAEELPGRMHPGGADAEQSLDHDDASQRREAERYPARTIGWRPTEEDPMALFGIEAGQIEGGRDVQDAELDPVLERIAQEPALGTVEHGEAVPESRLERPQPPAGHPVHEDHDGGSPGLAGSGGHGDISLHGI